LDQGEGTKLEEGEERLVRRIYGTKWKREKGNGTDPVPPRAKESEKHLSFSIPD